MAFKHSMMVSCALGALMTAPAFAQDQPTQGTAPSAANNNSEAAAPAAQTSTSSEGIQEIVVTANKRVENLQRVAASVAAVSQAQITRQGVKDPADITKVVPEVQIQAGQYSNVAIRGIKTGAYGPTTDSPNALHIDGAYVSRFNALQGLFFDVQRIEVLQGPQGTLYGRNSAGGTINIISNKPTQELGGAGSLEYGNYNQFTASIALNVPLSDTLAIRGAFYHFSHRGYLNNGLDDAAQTSGRFSALWKPTSTDSLLVTADREVQGGRGAAPQGEITSVLKNPTISTNPTPTPCAASRGAPTYLCVVPAGTPGGVVVPIKAGSSRDYAGTLGSFDAQRLNQRSLGFMGQYDHDFGWATLTAQGSYRRNIVDNKTGTVNGYPQDGRLITTGILVPAALGGNTNNAAWNSQEIRLTSPSGQQLTYVLGLYRFHEKDTNGALLTYNITYPNSPFVANPASQIGTYIVTNPPVVSTYVANALNVDNSYAVFGQATYSPAFLEGLHVTGGVRYNDEKKHGIGFEILNTVINPQSQFDLHRHDTAVTYKANVSFDITPRNLIYFDNSTGFKSGGFAYGFNAAYNPEKITSYEIGTKNRFFNDKLQINASAWHYDYRNIVTTVFQFYFNTATNSLGTIINTTNGKRAKIDGQSISIDFQPDRDNIFSFSGTHINPRFTEYDISATYQTAIQLGLVPGATNATFNYAGTPIGNDPKYVFNASYDHVFHVLNGALDAQAAVHYTGKRLFGNQVSKADLNNYIIGSPYATGDLSLRYQADGRRWSITTYVRNFTNKDVHLAEGYSSNAAYLPISDPRVQYAYRTTTYGPPRTYGLILSYDF